MKPGALTKSRRIVLLGLIAVLATWTWQFLTVHYNYGGNWTALFRIRPGMPVPDFLKSENLYIFYNSEGYDGQVYHLIAHDPWMRKGSAGAIVDASFRYQRILVPALAWMLALGRDSRIDAAYFAVILAFVFFGVYWMSRLATRIGRTPVWGLVFLLAPATIVSIDRMTVDIALAAFAAGFACYAERAPAWRVLVILTCAALTRETAAPIIAGYAVFLFTRRRFLDGVLAAATLLPAAAWYLYLRRVAAPSPLPSYLSWIPFSGFAERILHPAVYAGTPWRAAVATACDYLALAGIALAFVYAARLAIERRWDAQSAAVYALAIAAAFVQSRSVWQEAYAFARVLTPFLLLAALQFFKPKTWIAFAPLLLPDTAVALGLWGQIQGVLNALLK
jgi:hypothetical protein